MPSRKRAVAPPAVETPVVEPPAPVAAIEGIAPARATVLLAGRRCSRRTTTAAAWAAAVLTGQPWQDHEVPAPGKVLWLALGRESITDIRDLVDNLAGQPTTETEFRVMAPKIDPIHDPAPMLVDSVQGVYDLVVIDGIDGLGKYADGGPGRESWVRGVVTLMRRFVAETSHTACVLLVEATDTGGVAAHPALLEGVDVVHRAATVAGRTILTTIKADTPPPKVVRAPAHPVELEKSGPAGGWDGNGRWIEADPTPFSAREYSPGSPMHGLVHGLPR